MADVSVIGTGAMGSTLAWALHRAGHRITVWNRTSAKAAALRDGGLSVAERFIDAAHAGDLLIFCLTNYDAVAELLSEPDFGAAIKGKSVLQTSTGTSVQARQGAALVHGAGGQYLHGAILAYPREIGEPHCMVLYGGEKSLYERHLPVLKAFGGSPYYCGSDVGVPSALDASLLLFLTSGLMGYLQSAALAKAEGIALTDYLGACVKASSILAAWLPDLNNRMADRNFAGDEFPISGYAAVDTAIGEHANSLGVRTPLLESFISIFSQAEEAGRGSDGLAALFEASFGG